MFRALVSQLDSSFEKWVFHRDNLLDHGKFDGELPEVSRFNLRSLLVLTAFAAVLLAWQKDKLRWQAELREERAARELAEGKLDYLNQP